MKELLIFFSQIFRFVGFISGSNSSWETWKEFRLRVSFWRWWFSICTTGIGSQTRTKFRISRSIQIPFWICCPLRTISDWAIKLVIRVLNPKCECESLGSGGKRSIWEPINDCGLQAANVSRVKDHGCHTVLIVVNKNGFCAGCVISYVFANSREKTCSCSVVEVV